MLDWKNRVFVTFLSEKGESVFNSGASDKEYPKTVFKLFA